MIVHCHPHPVFLSLETGYQRRTGRPPDEVPINLIGGASLFERLTVMPRYSRIEALGSDFTNDGGFTGGDDFQR